MDDLQWKHLQERLAKSRFRSEFSLSERDLAYINTQGMTQIRRHAFDFVTKRLAPALPKNDTKQTPYKGHPVFVAQHATATCCRKCLLKWHRIAEGKKLSDAQIHYIVEVIMRWIASKTK